MSNKKTLNLVFTKDAPDEVKNGVQITFGTEFSRLFKQTEEPFQVDRNIGLAILRNYDYFEKSAAAPAEELTLSGLKKLQREVLDAKAREYGVEKPEDLPNKEAVAKALLKADAAKSSSDNSDSSTAPSEPAAQPLDPNKGEIIVPEEASDTESSEEKSDESEKAK